MEAQQKTAEETRKDIENRLESLSLSDKWHDEPRILERRGKPESTKDAVSPIEPQLSIESTQIGSKVPQNIVLDKSSSKDVLPDNPVPTETPQSSGLRETVPTQPLIRFRRPVLTDDVTSGMTDSYETLTLSEVRQLDLQWDADDHLQLEEFQLDHVDFDEVDEFEEVDEFDEDWEEEGVGIDVDGDWDVEYDGYCEAGDCEEEYLDDRF